MEQAERLGISLKRFQGWEPETTYTHDETGRLLSSRPEPEWDERQQDWMLALDFYRKTLCPLCGLPIMECTDPDNEGRYDVELPIRCHRTTALTLKQDEDRDAGFFAPAALMYRATLRRRR